MRAEVPGVHLVHLREVSHVREIDVRLHDVGERRSGRAEHRLEIGKNLLRLLRRRAADELPALRIERHLARGKDEGVRGNRLAVGANRCRGAVSGNDTHQKSPSIVPSGWIRIRSAAGLLPSPGIVRMSPASATTKPAPADGRMSRTCSMNPVGAPSWVGSSENEYCVFAMQTGVSPRPSLGSSSSARSAAGAKETPPAPYISRAIVSIFS